MSDKRNEHFAAYNEAMQTSAGDIEAPRIISERESAERDRAYAAGKSAERAAVVKYLRDKAADALPGWDRFELNNLAGAIERGAAGE